MYAPRTTSRQDVAVEEIAAVAVSDGNVERRTRPHLRVIFEQAYAVAYPLLDSNGGSSAHFLRVVLRDAFPDLHPQDVAILSASIERVFRERGKPASQ